MTAKTLPAARALNPRRALLVLGALACVGCDQAAKRAAVAWLSSAGAVEVAGGMVRLDPVENAGAFLSLGAGLPSAARWWILTGGVGAALAAAAILGLRAAPMFRRRTSLGYALFLGGGASNWVDRLVSSGRVVDFVQLRLGIFRTGIFNLADAAILAGAALLVAGACSGAKTRGGGGDGPSAAPPPAVRMR